jgi:hypothetical protein
MAKDGVESTCIYINTCLEAWTRRVGATDIRHVFPCLTLETSESRRIQSIRLDCGSAAWQARRSAGKPCRVAGMSESSVRVSFFSRDAHTRHTSSGHEVAVPGRRPPVVVSRGEMVATTDDQEAEEEEDVMTTMRPTNLRAQKFCAWVFCPIGRSGTNKGTGTHQLAIDSKASEARSEPASSDDDKTDGQAACQ